jgi:hypothetical protein
MIPLKPYLEDIALDIGSGLYEVRSDVQENFLLLRFYLFFLVDVLQLANFSDPLGYGCFGSRRKPRPILFLAPIENGFRLSSSVALRLAVVRRIELTIGLFFRRYFSILYKLHFIDFELRSCYTFAVCIRESMLRGSFFEYCATLD